MRSQGFQINFVRVDEDRGLARSAEFCELILELNCVLETTSGGNSTNNGMVERGNRVNANMVRASLTTLKSLLPQDELPTTMQIEELWCFALQHCVYIQRRMYNRLRKDIPYFLVFKKRPSALDMVIFGCWMTVVNPSKNLLPKLDNNRASQANFIGFGNNCSTSKIYWSHKQPRKYFRSHHNKLDIPTTLSILQEQFASPALPSLSTLQHRTPSLSKCVISPQHFDYTSNRFPPEDIFSITFTVPPPPTPIGALIRDDLIINLPFIQRSLPDSPIYNSLPPDRRHNQFILAINHQGPITTKFAVSLLKDAQMTTSRSITLDLVRRGPSDTSTSLQLTRSIFDSFPTIAMNRPIMNSASTSPPSSNVIDQSPYDNTINNPVQHHLSMPSTHDHFITSATKPDRPRSFFDALKSPF